MSPNIGRAAKALVGAAIAFVGALTTAAVSGHITMVGWLTSAGAGLVALGSVYGVPNAAPRDGGTSHDPNSNPQPSD